VRRFLAGCFDFDDRAEIDCRTGLRSLSARASAPPQRAWYFSGGSDGSEIRIRQPQTWQTMKSLFRSNWQRLLLRGVCSTSESPTEIAK
jgi:hypothetical protein